MQTFITDIIPKIQKFSQKLDDLTKLTNQHWVSISDIEHTKRVYIFRTNNQLLISENGIVEKATWDYLGNESLLIETIEGNFLLKHVFFDSNVIALKLDSTNKYAFFVNETKYNNELNSIDDVLSFLKKNYLDIKKGKLEKKTNNRTSFFSFSEASFFSFSQQKFHTFSEQNSWTDNEFSEEQKEWFKNPNLCPGCGFSGVINKSECPDCGLHLI